MIEPARIAMPPAHSQHVERVGHDPARRQHEEQDPDERVGADLRHHAGDEAGHRRRGVRVDVGQPAVEREQAHLDRQADDHQHDRDRDGRRFGELRQARREVRHVQRAGEP
jgi:hypothetical protein